MSTMLAAIFDFSKILIFTKMQQIFLKLVENMCFYSLKWDITKNRVENKELEQF